MAGLARTAAAVLILLALTAAVYAQTARHDFISYDDNLYVTGNRMVGAGLTAGGIRWAFGSFAYSNWHPLTWLSHMLDVQLWGPDAGGHHLTSVLLHALSGAALFLVVRALTGAAAVSFLTAALFLVHPLHVESVAWVAERKDVLCAFLWMLTMAAYVFCLRRPSLPRHGLVAAAFALALLAKPMAVTLPFVLLLLDYWPLGRLRLGAGRAVLEKIPLLALSAASSVVTLLAQRSGGSVSSLSEFPLATRLAHALNTYVFYLAKMFWPARLVVFYPYPVEEIPLGRTAGSAALLLLVSVAALAARRFPAGIIGWLWYLGTLVPVIGLVQLETQAAADRYTYLPLVGIFLALSAALASLTSSVPRLRAPVACLTAAAVLLLAGAAHRQVSYWKDSLGLFGHAISVDPANWVAQSKYGTALIDAGRPEEGSPHLQESFRLNPLFRAEVYFRSGAYFAQRGMFDEAMERYRRSLAILPPSMERKAAIVRRAMEDLERSSRGARP